MTQRKPQVHKILSWSQAKLFILTLQRFYPRLFPTIVGLIILNSVILSIPSIFMQKVVATLQTAWEQNLTWPVIQPIIYHYVKILAVLYVISLLANITYNQLLAVFTQGCLCQIRERLFAHMESLPIRYFDTHKRGDVMSYYTNDVEALRQVISQSFPQLLVSAVTVVALFAVMVYYSVWMSLVVVGGSLWSVVITRKVGGKSAQYFLEQQHALGRCEGFMEEMINGGKVIKVFSHEELSKADFNKENEELYQASFQANKYSNTLMPILNNVSYLIYIIVASFGGLFLNWDVPNLSISGLPFTLAVIIPFLGMSRQFAAAIQQISPQINAIVLAMAGAERIFGLMAEDPEEDHGHVTLVPPEKGCKAKARHWSWQVPQENGTYQYVPLTGEVHFRNVDFAYDHPPRHQHHRPPRTENCPGRRHRSRQNHHHQPAEPFLRHHQRHHHL